MEYLQKFNELQHNFVFEAEKTWASDYRVPFAAGAVYLAVIFGGRFLMSFRKERFEARLLSIVHNFNMFLVSLICMVGIFYGVFDLIMNHTLSESVELLFCDEGNKLKGKGPMYFWMYIFYLSKFYELLDTVLIVLRKGQLRFLHVYHHWITMLLCILSLNSYIPYQWVATGLNAVVHVPMYWYYLMAILKVEVWWKKYITSIQIIQFCLDISSFGLSAVWNKYWVKETVCSSWEVWWYNYVASSIVASYLVLFIQFYIEVYLSGRNKKPAAGASKPADKTKKTN
eukprot:TRINITY_DN2304_c0_g1_i1.p1 TRINITY_DN2304_c0_g1~~TRINITY_DN2304_c0_g1_i1.p1  ORF type:complete len:285 (-),score=76.76 TRINITY_DN2304_c0_g1_i1:260-1114(-)